MSPTKSDAQSPASSCKSPSIGWQSPRESSSRESPNNIHLFASSESPKAGSSPGSDEPQIQLSLSAEEDSHFKRLLDDEQAEQNPQKDSSSVVDEAQQLDESANIELRFLVRRREAGALIGKRGSNIKRLRDTFRSSMFSIPDTGNGPERVVCINTNERHMEAILSDLSQLLMEKSAENDEQIELKLLIHSSHAGSIIGLGGQSIKKLRNDSKAAIKIYEMCCPLSNERVCAIKAKPSVVVATIKLIHSILAENPIKGTVKPYDALHVDLELVDKYGGYLPDEHLDIQSHYEALAAYSRHSMHASDLQSYPAQKHFGMWPTNNKHFDEQSTNGCNLSYQCATSLQSCPTRVGKWDSDAPEETSSESGEQLGKQSWATNHSYLARAGARFHPYSGSFPAASRPHPQMLAQGYSSRFHLGPQMHHQHRSHCLRAPTSAFVGSMSERCRHSRPCLCMFLPILPDGVVQLADNCAIHSRNATGGRYKNK